MTPSIDICSFFQTSPAAREPSIEGVFSGVEQELEKKKKRTTMLHEHCEHCQYDCGNTILAESLPLCVFCMLGSFGWLN